MHYVGGSTNEKLKAQIRKLGGSGLYRFDRERGILPWMGWDFATVKELKETIRLLQQYPLPVQ